MHADEVYSGIFVGDHHAAGDFDFMIKNNVKRVVNCTTHIPNYYSKLGVKYFNIPVLDSTDSENQQIMATMLPDAVSFATVPIPSKYTNAGSVLIHCHAGMSRSCTVAAAVVSTLVPMTTQQSIQYIKSKRHIAFANGVYFKNPLDDFVRSRVFQSHQVQRPQVQSDMVPVV